MKKMFAPLLLAAATLLLTLPVDARGRGGGGGPRVSRSGPASHGSVRHSGGRRDAGRDARRDRRDSARDIRRDRRDTARDIRSERREFARDVRHERHEWWEDRSRRRVGAMLTVTAFRSLTCTPTTIIVNGVAYYSCDSVWYSRRYVGGSVTYVVVTAPAGY